MIRFHSRLLRDLAVGAALSACAGASTVRTDSAPGTVASPATANSAQDTTGIIPAGFGSLRQDDISIRMNHLGLTVQAMPLEEDFLRTLAPDSYRALVALRESKRPQLDSIARRAGLPTVRVWHIKFFNNQQGAAPFSARDVTLTSGGRDYQPLDVLGLSVGFGEGRVRQGESAQALLAFDSSMNPNQLLTIRLETQSGGDWQSVLRRVEAERALIRSRANKGTPERTSGGTTQW